MSIAKMGRQLTASQESMIGAVPQLDGTIARIDSGFTAVQDTQLLEDSEVNDAAVLLEDAHGILLGVRKALPEYVDHLNTYKRKIGDAGNTSLTLQDISPLSARPSASIDGKLSGNTSEAASPTATAEAKPIKKPPINAFQFREMYTELGIDLSNLGCVMLNTDPIVVSDVIAPEHTYHARDSQKLPYVKGISSEVEPHITLLFGLLQSGQAMRKQIDTVLSGWSIDEIVIQDIDYFVSPHEDEPYYTLVAHPKVTPKLLEGNDRLRMLPHVNTFPEYLPHITLAFIKQDHALLEKYLAELSKKLVGKKIRITGLNYGK